MQDQAVYKQDKSTLERLVRLVWSVIDPRAYLHLFKIINYYNYTHVAELRRAKQGAGLRISPTASLSNASNIEFGDHVRIGANVSIWAGTGRGRIVIGDHTMIAPNAMLTAANYRFQDGSPINDQAMDEAEIVIGRDVWIGANVIVLPGVRIGDYAIIGAGAVLRSDVEPSAVVVGSSTRQAGRRLVTSVQETKDAHAQLAAPDQQVLDWLKTQNSLSDERLALPIDSCGLDSFELITLRTGLEQRFSVQIADRDWAEIDTLGSIARLPVWSAQTSPTSHRSAADASQRAINTPARDSLHQTVGSGRASRTFDLNMPQMALAGLSESWLFKELGDLHWAMITDFLGTSSGSIADETGSRLYATFTRIKLEADPGLRAFKENDSIEMRSKLDRFGASFFFGAHDVTGPAAAVRASTMSTFAKYGERGKNTSLIKGAPVLPDPDAIPSQSEYPPFGMQYREMRANPATDEPIFECEYEQLGPHDINGVGLLYFAAYPIIFDICVGQFEGKEFLLSHTTASKDVCYFANAEPTETLIFRMHQREADAEMVRHVASLSRKSDGKCMAQIIGEKRFVGLQVP